MAECLVDCCEAIREPGKPKAKGREVDLAENVTATMFVQVARRMRFDGVSLTLLDLAPSTVYLRFHPVGAVGHLPTGPFLDAWYEDASGIVIRSVPAVLSLLDFNRGPASDAHIVLSLPRIREAGLEYQTQQLAGEIPSKSGACVLFIWSAVPPDWLGLLARRAPPSTDRRVG